MKEMIYIEWLDSMLGSSGWQDLSDFSTDIPTMKSVGFLIYETDSLVALAGSISYETPHSCYQGTGIITIPKCSIMHRKELNP